MGRVFPMVLLAVLLTGYGGGVYFVASSDGFKDTVAEAYEMASENPEMFLPDIDPEDFERADDPFFRPDNRGAANAEQVDRGPRDFSPRGSGSSGPKRVIIRSN
ncbi:MAG: hypothetical protein AAF667_18560 [Pseudomonadota bacterium]